MSNAFVGRTCPYCQNVIKRADEIVECPACQTVHHRECWLENNGRCTTPMCSGVERTQVFRDRWHRTETSPPPPPPPPPPPLPPPPFRVVLGAVAQRCGQGAANAVGWIDDILLAVVGRQNVLLHQFARCLAVVLAVLIALVAFSTLYHSIAGSQIGPPALSSPGPTRSAERQMAHDSAPATRQRGTDATNGQGTQARREVPWMPDEEPRSFCVTIIVSGLAFAGEQSKRINELGSQHYLKLWRTNEKLTNIYTDEQNKASHDAMEAARNAGKTDSEVLQAGRDAVKLTAEQKAERKALLAEIINENKRLEADVMAALTYDQRAQLKERRERLKPYVDYSRYFR